MLWLYASQIIHSSKCFSQKLLWIHLNFYNYLSILLYRLLSQQFLSFVQYKWEYKFSVTELRRKYFFVLLLLFWIMATWWWGLLVWNIVMKRPDVTEGNSLIEDRELKNKNLILLAQCVVNESFIYREMRRCHIWCKWRNEAWNDWYDKLSMAAWLPSTLALRSPGIMPNGDKSLKCSSADGNFSNIDAL